MLQIAQSGCPRTMDSATIMLKARLLANVKMAGKPKGQGKTQVKAGMHAN